MNQRFSAFIPEMTDVLTLLTVAVFLAGFAAAVWLLRSRKACTSTRSLPCRLGPRRCCGDLEARSRRGRCVPNGSPSFCRGYSRSRRSGRGGVVGNERTVTGSLDRRDRIPQLRALRTERSPAKTRRLQSARRIEGYCGAIDIQTEH